MDFKDLGRVAIITGAGKGMGRSHALALAKAGAKVLISDISEEDCQKVLEEIKKEGGEAIAVKCDVRKKSEVEAMVNLAVDKWGKIDILVNNAGIAGLTEYGPFLEMTEETWDRVLDTNLKGSFLCAQACAKEMVKQKKGVIINIASTAMGQVGIGEANMLHYTASKGGVVAMTQALALELAAFNIRVNAVSPGLIDTPMTELLKQMPELLEPLLSKIPMGRFGEPEEVSNLVLFLASDQSSYMTGSTIVIDGGSIAG